MGLFMPCSGYSEFCVVIVLQVNEEICFHSPGMEFWVILTTLGYLGILPDR